MSTNKFSRKKKVKDSEGGGHTQLPGQDGEEEEYNLPQYLDCSPHLNVRDPSPVQFRQPIEILAKGRNVRSRKRRRTGCECPINYCVFLAWAVTILEGAAVALVFIPAVDEHISSQFALVASVIITILLIFIAIMDILCMMSDPTEPLLYQSKLFPILQIKFFDFSFSAKSQNREYHR